MKILSKTITTLALGALALIPATPTLAAGGWGFGQDPFGFGGGFGGALPWAPPPILQLPDLVISSVYLPASTGSAAYVLVKNIGDGASFQCFLLADNPTGSAIARVDPLAAGSAVWVRIELWNGNFQGCNLETTFLIDVLSTVVEWREWNNKHRIIDNSAC